jgi:hypothetical protein
MIDDSGRSVAHACGAISASSVPWLAAKIESAFPLPCFFSILASSFFPSLVWRRKRTAASEKAH